MAEQDAAGVSAKDELPRLRAAQLPRCDWREFLTVTGGEMLPEDEAALDAYFRQFLPPGEGKCICCGETQGGDIVAVVLGRARFQWGLAYGQGFCSECGYPARAYHNVGPIKRLEMILQVHPDELLPDPPQAERME